MAKKTTTAKKTTANKKKSAIKSEFDLLDDKFVTTEDRERADAEKAAEEQSAKDAFKVKRLGPFDIMKMMFADKSAFDRLTDAQLKEHYFIINRRFRMSIARW